MINIPKIDNTKELEDASRRIKKREIFLDKIQGSLIGGAVGDALGYAVEFESLKRIQAKYGERGIQKFQLQNGLARISDDTQMTLFTANGILCAETKYTLHGLASCDTNEFVYKAYLDWLKTQCGAARPKQDSSTLEQFGISWLLDVPELFVARAPGNTCLNALGSGIKGSIAKPINDSKGCGGIMRVAPLALRYGDTPSAGLDTQGAELAAITHGHSLGYIPAAVFTHIVAAATYGTCLHSESFFDIVEEAMFECKKIFGDDKNWRYFENIMNKAIEFADPCNNTLDDFTNIKNIGEGWVAEETLAIAVYCCLRHADDFSAAIIASVNHDGDSDSTGAITGNIMGALLGYDMINDKWKRDLELHNEILEIAKDLCHGCQMHAYGAYRDKKWLKKYEEGKIG